MFLKRFLELLLPQRQKQVDLSFLQAKMLRQGINDVTISTIKREI